MNLRLAVCGLALAGLVAGIGIGWGQQTVSPSSGTLQPITMTASEVSEIPHLSDTQLEVFLDSLNATPTIPYTSLPRNGMAGTVMSLAHPTWPGLPGDMNSNAVWQMDGFYLLDDVEPPAATAMKTSLDSQAATKSVSGPPAPGGGGGGTNLPPPTKAYVFNTNGLWLEITNVSNGWSYLNLHNGTNQVYAIWSTTNLLTDWQLETELWPTNGKTIPTVTPFTIETQTRPNLFLRAEDWTGLTGKGETTPDWWLWEYLGTTTVADTNLDYSGNKTTFAQDYTNHVAPVVFSFTGITVSNNFVNSSLVPMRLSVAGYPYYLAVSVDDTNFATDAKWQLYTGTNITVNLTNIQGWHNVGIGLRGSADPVANAVWQWEQMKLDIISPALFITGLTNGTINVPLLQLTGYSPKPLGNITYNLSNAAGTATNQQVLLTGQAYNTSTYEYTTNYFQCYDVPLANGTNTFTFHATDMAGNVGSLMTNIIYIPNTNPPSAKLIWPQGGLFICNKSVTVQGQVNDPTAVVTLTGVDTNGNTKTYTGLTGRDGIFYLQNVPLNAGVNALTLAVATQSGGTTNLNFSLIETNATLTVNPVNAGDTNVSGTVASGYTVYANGAKATNNGSTWTAPITPITIGGGVVQVEAVPTLSGPDLYSQATVPSPQGVFVSGYYGQSLYSDIDWNDYFLYILMSHLD
jgi:hypothetical protein